MPVSFVDVFTHPENWPDHDAVLRSTSITADVTLLAYHCGVFPMPISEPGEEPWMWWWSPVHRGILPVDQLRVTRSLRASARKYTVTVDTAFDEVLRRCADPTRDGGWIDQRIVDVYTVLHQRGYVHSVETWTLDGRLAGGLYGVSIGGLFAGESMFHDPVIGRDASKVALWGLIDRLRAAGDPEHRVVDVQWQTDHLATLGVRSIPRGQYLAQLPQVLALPGPSWKDDDA